MPRVIFLRFSTPSLRRSGPCFLLVASSYVAHSSDFGGLLRFSCRFGCRLALSDGSFRNAIPLGALVGHVLSSLLHACGEELHRFARSAGENSCGRSSLCIREDRLCRDAEFTLDLNKKESEKLKLLIDSETKMKGKLAIGANAAVDYRSSDGKYIATHVVMVPDSGLRH